MAEPVPAAGGAPRRWWDVTPRELNIVVVTLLFLITLPMLTKIFTSDFGTHIAMGRQIVQTFTLPDTEYLNYPSLGRHNPNGEWGFQAILWPIWSWGGAPGLAVWRWATTLVAFGLLWQAVVALGRSLGKRVIAEGIETVGQFDRLVGLDCERGQGNLLAHPLPAQDIPALIRESRLYAAAA